MTMFLSKNPSSFNKTLKKFISKHKSDIKENHICTVIVIRKFGRQYLHPWMRVGEDKVIGGDRAPIKFTNSETIMCKALLENPTAKLKELSKTTKLSFKTLSSKLKLLKKREIIRKFEPVLDGNKLGIINKRVLIKYSAYDVKTENDLTNFCKESISVVSIIKTFGSWDLIINFESLKEEVFDSFMQELRERFEELIIDFDSVEVKNKEKFTYLPSNHFL
jgi:DNA-binding Lrp family transcriptional regulator